MSHTSEPDGGFDDAKAWSQLTDLEYCDLLRRAERGALLPGHFERIDELLPHVSPELREPFGSMRWDR